MQQLGQGSTPCRETVKRILCGFLLLAAMVALPAHATWWGGVTDTSVAVQTLINGEAAGSEPGYIAINDTPITHTFRITNTGEKKLRWVKLYGYRGVAYWPPLEFICGAVKLAPGESHDCTLESVTIEGPHVLTAYAVAQGPGWWRQVYAIDESYYYGIPGYPSLSVESTIQGKPASVSPGPEILAGAPYTWEHQIRNSGPLDLTNIKVERRQSADAQETLCLIDELPAGEATACSGTGSAESGLYNADISVTGDGPANLTGETSSPLFYSCIDVNPKIEIEITLKGQASHTAPGPEIPADTSIQWIYNILNSGDAPLTEILVTGRGISPETTGPYKICRIERLEPGESGSCERTEVASVGQFEVQNSVKAQARFGLNAQDRQSAFYTAIEGARLQALPRAVPTAGPAPLTVTFTPDVTTNSAIETYAWDFEGDGNYDRSETVGRNQSYTYRQPGKYSATLRVSDSQGNVDEGVVVITVDNGPPDITRAEASPSTGELPLAVRFLISATDEDRVSSVEIDVEGDGTFDIIRETNDESVTVSADFIYKTKGTYAPAVRVSDALGASSTAQIPTLEVRALDAGSPSVTAKASPSAGKAPLTVTLDASAVDPDELAIVKWEWDLEGDGSYDVQSTTTAQASHIYQSPGTFYPRVRATAEDGQAAEDVVAVKVEAEFSLRVTTDTIDTSMGETAIIRTTLGGTTSVSVVVENVDGTVVKILVPWAERSAGTYSDSWNGSDDSGSFVGQGEYRAVLLYEVDGVTQRLDLGTNTGGSQYNPSRSRIPSSFTPLAGKPLTVEFTLNRASEVTAFMGLFNINTRLVTFLQRKPLGKGTHRIVWNGEDDSGSLINPPPGDSFLFGIWGWTLPDNAIYVRSGAHITALTVSPRILVPSSRASENSNGEAVISFSLSDSAHIEVTIDNTETGTQVYKSTYPGLAGGNHVINWDGHNSQGDRVAPGTYRIGITAIDEHNYRSMTVYRLQQVYY